MPRPLVGAIRWDAWYGKLPGDTKRMDPASQTRRTLSEPAWYWRLPFYTTFDKDGKVDDINGARPEILEKEIELACDSGIDYWAFAFYEKKSLMSRTLQNYLKCGNRSKVKFCLFLIYGFTSNPEMLQNALELATRPEYLKVQGNRPVFFIDLLTADSIEALKKGVWEEFCHKVEAKGLGRPYTIIGRTEYCKEFKGDAVSAYCPGSGNVKSLPYSNLTKQAEDRWLRWESAGVNVVPTCTAGWDMRPRMQNPVSWVKGNWTGKWIETCFLSGEPDEIAAHIKRGVDWHKTHPSKDGVKLTLIYAWNEYDEGGWIAPTLPPPVGEGTARLDAIKKVLRP